MRILLPFLVIFHMTASAESKINIVKTPISINGALIEYCSIPDSFSSSNIPSLHFKQFSSDIINFGSKDSSYVLKLSLKNLSKSKKLQLSIPIPYFDFIEFYKAIENRPMSVIATNDEINPTITLDFSSKETKVIYIRIKSFKKYIVPIKVDSYTSYEENKTKRSLIFGAFLGVMMCMLFYNIVLTLFTRDKNYTYYIIYIIFITAAQFGFLGLNKFTSYNDIYAQNLLIYIGSSLAGIAAALFAMSFLKLRDQLPAMYKLFVVLIFLYSMVAITFSAGLMRISYSFIEVSGLYSAIIAIWASVLLISKGHQEAKIYLLSWSVLIAGLVINSMKDFGIFPTNNFTIYSFPFGVALETVLLSIALAYRINTLRRENEDAQERIILEMTRNENLIKNQNFVLEEKVTKRTEELEQTLSNLKKAQVKLIESEKMASLGVLTAGIAHEINNPINYVTANVHPLRDNIQNLTELLEKYQALTPENMDVQMKEIQKMENQIELEYTLKETEELINGIEEGAKRTYNIVDGLRTFSRSDTAPKQKADINKGLQSTAAVLKSQIGKINFTMDLDPNIPLIECQLGKLNQVFLNLTNNAIHAIEEKFSEDKGQGELIIKSMFRDNQIVITISDNGNGIEESKRTKIFEPFFTSKPVGKGTGLGLSISYSIISEHKGELTFSSKLGQGTTFTISMPVS